MIRIKSLTLTIITESQVALSNDQGTGGNYTPIKKMFHKDGIHLCASVSTMTYELRKTLFKEFDWQLFDIVLNTDSKGKITNLYNVQTENTSKEADLFGYFIPGAQISRVSPLRIIPPVSLHKYHSDTQLITNRGFLNSQLSRKYYNSKNEEFDEIPTTQALATEEIMGDYYQYTITVELDRVGRIETKEKGDKIEYLSPSDHEFQAGEYRKSIIIALLEAVKIFTRDIKHQKIFLEPLAVFGGFFPRVVPYFANSILYKNNLLHLESIKQTIENHHLDSNSYLIKAVNSKIDVSEVKDFTISINPVGDLNKLIDFIDKKVDFSNENHWIMKN